jgi:WD40 repeat protein
MKRDKQAETPEVYAISRGRSGWSLSRRSVMSAAALAAAAAPRMEGAVCVAGALAHAGSTAGTTLTVRVAVSADGRLMVSAAIDRVTTTVKLWSLPDGAFVKRLSNSTASMLATNFYLAWVAISPDGLLLASGGADAQTIALWSLPDATLLSAKVDSGYPYHAFAAAVSPDGRLLATAGDSIALRTMPDLATAKRITTSSSSTVTAVAFSRDGSMLASGSDDRTICVWSVPEGVRLKTMPPGSGRVDAIALSPDSRYLVSGGADLLLWSVQDTVLLKKLDGHALAVTAVAITPDGRLLATASRDKAIRLWSLPDGAMLKILTGHAEALSSVAISPDGRLLVSASMDGAVKLWSLPDGKPLPICLMDTEGSNSGARAITYTVEGVTRTVPSGTPIPPGAVCTCNTVAGSVCTCVGNVCSCVGDGGGGGHYWYPN